MSSLFPSFNVTGGSVSTLTTVVLPRTIAGTVQSKNVTVTNSILRYRSFYDGELKLRLKAVEKEMIKFPRRADLKLEAMNLRKEIKRRKS